MSHYYKFDPALKSEVKEIAYDFRGERVILKTDLGVFSKDRIDFGTNVLLNSLLEKDLKTKKILDIGCGYGVVGICIGKKYRDSQIHLTDVNSRAIELAKQNQELNNLENLLIYESYIYEKIDAKFDCIITNPPIRAGKEVVHNIVLGGFDYLNNQGCIYVVIQKKQGAPSLLKEMEKVYNLVEILEKKNGYFILKGHKY